jgi:hypothetical protein
VRTLRGEHEVTVVNALAHAEAAAERVAIMVIDGGLPQADAERLAWTGLQTPGAVP